MFFLRASVVSFRNLAWVAGTARVSTLTVRNRDEKQENHEAFSSIDVSAQADSPEAENEYPISNKEYPITKERVFIPLLKGGEKNKKRLSGEFDKFLSGGCEHGVDSGGQSSALSSEKIFALAGHFTNEAVIAQDAEVATDTS